MAPTTSPVSRTKSRTCRGFIRTSRPITSWTSPPEQKPRPAPVSTTARIDGSFRNRTKVSRSATYPSTRRAFRRSGRLRVRVATAPDTSSRKGSVIQHRDRLDLDLHAGMDEGLDFDEGHARKVLAHALPIARAQGLPGR